MWYNIVSSLPTLQGSRDDVSVSGGVAGGGIPMTRHGNSVDASFSKDVLNSITGSHKQYLPFYVESQHFVETLIGKMMLIPSIFLLSFLPCTSFFILGGCYG